MYVLTYTTDQTNRLVDRNHHLMLGTTLRDDTFINVFYQKTLDVLDVPFRIRPDVTIPVGTYNMHEWYFTLQHQPGPAHLRARHRVARAVLRRHEAEPVGRRRRPRRRASSRPKLQYNRNDVKMPWGDFLVEPLDAAASTTRSRRG